MKKQFVRTCIHTLILAFLFQASAPSQTSALGTLKGVVTESTGAGVPAYIKIVQWGPDDTRRFGPPTVTHEKAVYADSDGKFSIQLKPGEYDVFIAYLVFSPFAKKVKVEAEKETVLSPRLKFDRLTKFVY
jgi:hypothetical protein